MNLLWSEQDLCSKTTQKLAVEEKPEIFQKLLLSNTSSEWCFVKTLIKIKSGKIQGKSDYFIDLCDQSTLKGVFSRKFLENKIAKILVNFGF